MSAQIEIYGAVYDHPDKGHDRLFIDHLRCMAGAIDGAGGAELSDTIVQDLPGIIKRNDRTRELSGASFLAKVLTAADNLPEGLIRKATAAFAYADLQAYGVNLAYGNAGDASVYFFNHDNNGLKLLAHTETTYLENRGQGRLINVRGFLGNRREERVISNLVGSLVIPVDVKWSMIGFSDGIQDDDGRGIDTETLKEILHTTPASEVPATILDAIEKYDDASVFCMSYTPLNG